MRPKAAVRGSCKGVCQEQSQGRSGRPAVTSSSFLNLGRADRQQAEVWNLDIFQV